ncbi:DMT family transporter [Conexibacter sp. SYSU D00693]|uniref:DMT family transporter n=1 Tax=Conexibacter sp. SYSU D00693 TaxID=2812560 RepID=UPI00196BAED1|nr:DMT family transporter [Conexibacter sp. SYSU D00693]
MSFTNVRCSWTVVSGRIVVVVRGPVLCLLSAVAFGAMGVFGKLAYDEGATVGTLLSVRFVLAAALFWLLVAATGRMGAVRSAPRRVVLFGIGLGAVGYALQAGGFFAALERLDASLTALVLYTYPTLVTAGAIVLGRERASRRRVGALLLASTGVALVLLGAGSGRLDPLGVAFALGAAAVYATYILVSDGVVDAVDPLVLSAFVATGAAVTLTGASLVGGDFRPGALTGAGWGWIAGIAVVSTVIAINLFFAGLAQVGPSAAAIFSSLEPVTTVVLAALAFGEALTAVQLGGGALVLSAVVLLNLRRRRAAVPAAGAPPVAARALLLGRARAARAAARG